MALSLRRQIFASLWPYRAQFSGQEEPERAVWPTSTCVRDVEPQ